MALLRVRQAAERLNISPSLITALCRAGCIKHRKIGLGRGIIRISEEDLAAYDASVVVEPAVASRSSGEKPETKPPTGPRGKRGMGHLSENGLNRPLAAGWSGNLRQSPAIKRKCDD